MNRVRKIIRAARQHFFLIIISSISISIISIYTDKGWKSVFYGEHAHSLFNGYIKLL